MQNSFNIGGPCQGPWCQINFYGLGAKKFSWRTFVSKPLVCELKVVVASLNGEKALKVEAGTGAGAGAGAGAGEAGATNAIINTRRGRP